LQSLLIAQRRQLLLATVELGRERAHLREIDADDGTRRHQLRSGLATIGGSVWMLEHREQHLDEPARTQLLEVVTREVRRLQRLVDGSPADRTIAGWERGAGR
jgi:K+-sensing histidine kinase KdpD